MIEIALSLAIIAFGLVAIIGVLPSGMAVQRDNRWNAIINEDGQFWLNAIRNGLREGYDLTNYVQTIQSYTSVPPIPIGDVPASNYEIVGRLSQPFVINRARVRSISSPATELKTGSSLEYVMFTMITDCPLTAVTNVPTGLTNLWDVRLVFMWPVFGNIPNDTVGNSKKTFRTLVQGSLEPTTNGLHFFNHQLLIP